MGHALNRVLLGNSFDRLNLDGFQESAGGCHIQQAVSSAWGISIERTP